MKQISVTVKTKSKKEYVEQIDPAIFTVAVNVPPVDGAANKKVILLLSKFFKIPKSSIELIKGHKSKIKIFMIHS